jgi:hypothetical protein
MYQTYPWMEKPSESGDCRPRIEQHNDGPLFNVAASRFQECLQLAKNGCYLRDGVEGLQECKVAAVAGENNQIWYCKIQQVNHSTKEATVKWFELISGNMYELSAYMDSISFDTIICNGVPVEVFVERDAKGFRIQEKDRQLYKVLVAPQVIQQMQSDPYKLTPVSGCSMSKQKVLQALCIHTFRDTKEFMQYVNNYTEL